DRDPLRRARSAPHTSRSDVLDRLEGAAPARASGEGALLFKARDQILALLERALPERARVETSTPTRAPADAVRAAVLAGFSDRVARRRESGSPRAVMVGGRGVRLAADSAVTAEELFVCVVV